MENNKTGYASIDKPWSKFYPQTEINIKDIEKSIYQMLEESVKDSPNSIALEYFGIKIKFKDYLEKIRNCAKSCKLLGIRKGDIVPLLLPNQPECRIMIYALNYIGAIPYPMQPTIPNAYLDKIMNENEIKNLFIFNGFYEKFENELKSNALKNIICTNGKETLPNILQKLDDLGKKLKKQKTIELPKNSKIIPFKEFQLSHDLYRGIISPYYEPNYTAAIIGTSGTTGTSKGVCLTNENLNAMALQHMKGDMNIEENDKLLDILIQSIGYGIAVMHYSGCCKIRSILIPELVKDVAPLFIKYKPNHFTGGPVHAESLENFIKNANKKELEKINKALKNVKNWVSGGASLSKRTEKFLNKDTVIIRQGLGCTENGGAATFTKKGTYEERTVGIPLMLETISIFEPDTDNELKCNEIGEICITGPTVMKGYLNNEEETQQVLKKHKDNKIWIHTKDLGYMNEDGKTFINGRIKNIFMKAGYKIFPAMVNEFLETIEGVEESHVLGINHPKEQMVPVAFISINNKTDIKTLKETILKEALKNINESSIPYQFVFIKGKLPRNLGGKIDPKQLLELSGIDYYQNDNNEDIIITIKTKMLNK